MQSTIIYPLKKQGYFDEKYANFEIIHKHSNKKLSPCPDIFSKTEKGLTKYAFL